MKICSILFCLAILPLFGAPIDENTKLLLVQKAIEAQQKSYAPYSKYYVGAALITQSGKIHLGCNVENASYGLTNCAERTAVFKAVSEGDCAIEAIAIITRNGGMPCGACRQVLNEFNPKMAVITADDQGHVYIETTLDQLLPGAFGPANLD